MASLTRRERHSDRAAAPASSAALAGPARLGKRTKHLVGRLAPGAVAILDHADLDAVATRALAARNPCAVINCRPSITGRYPNRGPAVLLDVGIPLFDLDAQAPGAPDLFALLADGEPVIIENEQLRRADGTPIAPLVRLTPERVRERLDAARENLDAELAAFAENTLRYLARPEERALLLDPVAVPPLQTAMAGRPVLVVVRGEHYEADVHLLRHYIEEQRPVLIAVDGAADTLLAEHIRPHVILGDMDSVGDAALRSGAEIVVHAYARAGDSDENAPGLARVRALGITENVHVFPVPGTSEDAALLLAYEKGADLIVAVGTHTNLEDFLDKGRRGAASTFLVRLKVGSRLVDARGVSRLYESREKLAPLFGFLLVSALFPLLVLLWGTQPGQVAWHSLVVWFRLLVR
jgi:uncharacterized membrane-anchored protein